MHQTIRRDPAMPVIRAVLALAGHAGALDEHRGIRWASATFTGMRHQLRLRFVGAPAIAAGDRLAAVIGEHEFRIPGHIVADAAVIERHQRHEGEPMLSLTVELLTVEDA